MRLRVWLLMLVVIYAVPVEAQSLPAFERSWGAFGSAPGQFQRPSGIAVGFDGHIYVADATNCRVDEFTPLGIFERSVGSIGSGLGKLLGPQDVAVDPSGRIYVADAGNARIARFSSDGTPLAPFALPLGASSVTSLGISQDGRYLYAMLGSGELEICDSAGVLYSKEPARGAIAQNIGIGVSSLGVAYYTAFSCDVYNLPFAGPRQPSFVIQPEGEAGCGGTFGVAAEGDSILYVAERTGSGRIFKVSQSGTWIGSWGANVGGDAQLGGAEFDLAVDPQRNIYVVDQGNSRIVKFSYGQVTAAKHTSWGRLKQLYR